MGALTATRPTTVSRSVFHLRPPQDVVCEEIVSGVYAQMKTGDFRNAAGTDPAEQEPVTDRQIGAHQKLRPGC
jgi:hypothetical protein